MRNRLLLTLILSSAFYVLGTAHPEFHGGWKLESERNGVKLYTRVTDGSQLKQVKGVANVKASMETIVGILTDYGSYSKWVNNITESYVVKEQSDTEHYVYTYEDAPWPVQNRYNVAKMSLDQNLTSCTLKFESVPDFVEQRADAIQVEKFKGLWKINALPNGSCHIEYILDENPGGYVPPWLVNYMLMEAPFKTLENLRALAEAGPNP